MTVKITDSKITGLTAVEDALGGLPTNVDLLVVSSWGTFSAAGSVGTESYNLGSVSIGGAGSYAVTFENALNSLEYAVVVSHQTATGGSPVPTTEVFDKTVNGFSVRTRLNGTLTSTPVGFLVMGGK